MCEQSWRGVPISEIYGSQNPWGAPEFPLIVPSSNHAVLYHVPSINQLVNDAPPKPRVGKDIWTHDFVRMPCSRQSLYPVEDGNGESHLKKRWAIIEQALSKPMSTSQDLANSILSYNTKFKTTWKFQALHKLFNEYLEEDEAQYFFNVTLPEIVKLALALPKLVQCPIPLLKQNKSMSISLSQQQIASLLANAFFCTFPRRNTTKQTSEYASYPYINFNRLYNSSGSESTLEKLKCICHYFRRVCTKVPTGAVTFSRRCVATSSMPRWPLVQDTIAGLPVHVDSETTIEEAHGLIQVDFANKFLGGGVLNFGCVQEEIRFVICPELMISMLFTEMLLSNEAIMIIGSERYSTYSGYGGSFHWTGDYKDTTPFDSSGRKRCAVLAIDALPYSSLRHEYDKNKITRELNKAWVGLSFGTDQKSQEREFPGVATGNWGCGAFGGSPQLKSLIQIMACSCARRPMAYFTFGDAQLRDEIINVYNLLSTHNVTVGQLFKYIVEYTSTTIRPNHLHQFLQQKLLDGTRNKLSDVMEVSDIPMETIKTEVLPTLKKRSNDSPDLFLQEDGDECFSALNTQINNLVDAAERGELTNNKMCLGKESSVKVTICLETSHEKDDNVTEPRSIQHSNGASKHTTNFLEEMQKFDDENGRLNLSLGTILPCKYNKNWEPTQSNDTLETEEKIKLDVSPEVKKKMSRKITDYFSKKAI
ncbi:hypothetical protein ACJJTC_006839 [Scirpophaga incertulas]